MTLRTLFASIILASCISNAFAQQLIVPPGNPGGRAPKPVPVKRCTGGWSGVVTYTKTLNDSLESDEPGIRKTKDRIKHRTSRDYKYTGRAIVDGKGDPKNVIVKTSLGLTDNDLHWSETRVWESCGNRGDTSRWQIIEGTDDRVTQGSFNGVATSFHLNVNEFDGSYSFSIGLPEFQGQYKREQHVKRSGFCQPRNNQPSDSSVDEPTRIDRDAIVIEEGKIDPKEHPDVISGSKTWGYDGTGKVAGFVYTASWRFSRCPQELIITEMKLEHPDFPDFEKWKEIQQPMGTTDGNRVKIKTKILNMSSEPRFATVKLMDATQRIRNAYEPPRPLPESDTTVRLDAGEEREIEYVWNTEGQSWSEHGVPQLLHEIKAELTEDGKKKDEKMKPLHISPKPLVLVHGLWSSADAWIPLYQNMLTEIHSYQWKAYAVGEKPEHGKLNTGGAFLSADKTNSMYENADELEKYIKYAQETSNAWHVDLVAHSLGGLISRLYIHRQMPDMPDGAPQVKHLVMLGTPNAGSPCADVIDMKFSASDQRVQAVKDLRPENVAIFNQHVNNRRRVKFSALAGQSLPVMCKNAEWNDGVVSVQSAIFGVADHAFTNDIHTDLTNAKNFGNFVLPHVITDARGKYPREVRSDVHILDSFKNIEWGMNVDSPVDDVLRSTFALKNDDEFTGNRFYGAAQPVIPGSANETWSKEMTVAAGQGMDIDLPVTAGPNLGVTFLADSDVSVSLVDPEGKVRVANVGGTTESKSYFRTLFIAKAVADGTWKLRVVSKAKVERIVMLTSWQAGGVVKKPDAPAAAPAQIKAPSTKPVARSSRPTR